MTIHSNWISTDRQLPPDDTDVIILYGPYNNHENERAEGSAYYIDGTFYDEDGKALRAPSHWLLLINTRE